MDELIRVIIALVSVAGIGAILWDAFEVIILPRRVVRDLRFTRLLHRAMWTPWRAFARRMNSGAQREMWLSVYGPMSLIVLLSVWATGMIAGFAGLLWGLGSPLVDPRSLMTPLSVLYASGVTFFTLGYGDIVPASAAARAIAVLEAGLGFGFLAIVIGYLPVIYQSFSRREVVISTLDARAGSPPHAAELIRRLNLGESVDSVRAFLQEWEKWSAELLESHLSYPVLCYYRSQHDNQSWLAALTTILDTCALAIVGLPGVPTWQARLTFAMTRHAVVDLAEILHLEPAESPERLPPADLVRLRSTLHASGAALREGADADATLAGLRALYEPYVQALADHLMLTLPPWIGEPSPDENWHDEQAPLAGSASPFAR